MSHRYVQHVFETLRSALSNAMREELIGRNVARLVKAPSRGHFDVEPMNEEDARRFINAVTTHWLHASWLTLITTGLRRGRFLAWSDVHMSTGAFNIRRTVQRVRGRLVFGEPKTKR